MSETFDSTDDKRIDRLEKIIEEHEQRFVIINEQFFRLGEMHGELLKRSKEEKQKDE